MQSYIIPLIVFMIIMFVILCVFLKIALARKKHLKQMLPTDIDVIIKKGDYYESIFYEFIQKKVMSDEAFDKSKAFTKDGKPTRYFNSNVNEMYQRAFPLYFVQPMKAKKYAFSEDFRNYILGEHSNTSIKLFMNALYGFEAEGFRYSPSDEDVKSDEDINIINNDSLVQQDASSLDVSVDYDRRLSKQDAKLDTYTEIDIHQHDSDKDCVNDIQYFKDDFHSHNAALGNRDWNVYEIHIKEVKKYVNSYVMSYFKKNGLQVKLQNGKTTPEYKHMYQMLYKGVSNVLFDGDRFTQDYIWWATDVYPDSINHELIDILPKYFKDMDIDLMKFNI